jgi:hypothetical protein
MLFDANSSAIIIEEYSNPDSFLSMANSDHFRDDINSSCTRMATTLDFVVLDAFPVYFFQDRFTYQKTSSRPREHA